MNTRDKHDNDNVKRIFEAIARDTIANNGGTYQHRTGAKVNHTDGYYVGVGNVATANLAGSSAQVVASILADVWSRTLPARAQYIGTWIDTHVPRGYGRLYVDYSVHIPGTHNLDIALACARRHGELAVWDCKNSVSIDVPTIADTDVGEIRALVAELHDAIFGEDSTASIVDEFGEFVADTWIVERLRVLTDAEYAECAYGYDE